MRLYYHDSYLRDFDARVVDRRGDTTVYLDRSAFYPASGGQPSDRGTLSGIAVVDVVDEEDGRIAHVLERPLDGDDVAGQIDWQRRFDHMQQHTGQHLLSSVFMDLFGMQTISFHMGSEVSTIDLSVPAISQEQLEAAEARACELVFENRPVTVTFQDAEDVQGLLRKASDRSGELRLVHIAEVDHSACGGTHVRATGEIGPIQIRKVDKIRGNVRLEFACGLRTVARSRRDYNALTAIARTFSAAVDETPALVAAQLEKAQEADKARRKLSSELAALQGKALYDATPASPDGVRRHLYRGPLTDEIRTQAQVFTAQPKAVFLALCDQPPSLLLAASKDSGVQAGATVKQTLSRGGGSPQMAQGSAASVEELQQAEQRITADWPKNSI